MVTELQAEAHDTPQGISLSFWPLKKLSSTSNWHASYYGLYWKTNRSRICTAVFPRHSSQHLLQTCCITGIERAVVVFMFFKFF